VRTGNLQQGFYPGFALIIIRIDVDDCIDGVRTTDELDTASDKLSKWIIQDLQLELNELMLHEDLEFRYSLYP
jgi:hypothetical protein